MIVCLENVARLYCLPPLPKTVKSDGVQLCTAGLLQQTVTDGLLVERTLAESIEDGSPLFSGFVQLERNYNCRETTFSPKDHFILRKTD